MVAVANIRTNVQAPFPTLVRGAAPITLAKQNGVWIIGQNTMAVGQITLNPANFPNQWVLVYDNNAGTFFRISLVQLAGIVRAQRSVTASPILVGANDQILNVNISAGSPTCTLPAASIRNGVPLTFKDVGGNFAAHPLTITPFGTDLIDGQTTPSTSITLSTNRQGVTLVPFNDGVNTGWAIE